MKDKLIDIIYGRIKDYDFYNYDNDEDFKEIEVREYTNILQEKVIDINLDNETYTIVCVKTYDGREK